MPRRLAVSACFALLAAACHQGAEPAGETAPPSRSPPLAAPEASRPETRKFRDWLVVCDNGAACVAFGPALNDQPGWVRVSLDAGGEAQPVVMAGFWGDDPNLAEVQASSSATDAAGAASRFALQVDGRRFPVDAAQTDDGGHTAEVRNQPRPLVDALASGRRLALTDGAASVQVSLSGAAAALLWIDERQGRAGTTTALIRRGDQPASTVPAAPVLPRVRAAGPAAQTDLAAPVLPPAFAARADVQACRADTRFNPSLQDAVSIDRLSPGRELWGVPCFAGAYNIGFRYFLTGPGGAEPQPLRFPTARQTTDEVVNSGYDPATRTLQAFDKGRGLGDCGVAATWVWTGRDFALKHEREMRECWGVPADLWPTTWRTAD